MWWNSAARILANLTALLLVTPSLAVTNFTSCMIAIQNGTFGTVGGTNNSGNAVPLSQATAITYSLCLSACGPGQEAFSWSDFSNQFSAWMLPYLALVSQLPFGARYKLDNLMSVFLTVGSPMMAGYSLALTVLNSRWIWRRFDGINYPNADLAKRALASLQQAPLIITTHHLTDMNASASADTSITDVADTERPPPRPFAYPLLSSLICLPQNGDYWDNLVDHLDFTHTWSISATTNLLWTAVAYAFTVVDSLGNLTSNINSNGQGVGSVWLWLLPIVIGWLRLEPKCDSQRLRVAFFRTSGLSYVATPHRGVVKASTISDSRALSLESSSPAFHSSLSTITYNNPCPTPPVYNAARIFTYAQAVETIAAAFEIASLNAAAHRTVDGSPWREGAREEIHPDNRMGTPEQVDAYCGLGTDLTRMRVKTPRFVEGVWTRIFIASVISLLLQWGTTGAAIIVVWYTPTIGLGCRSGAYLLYGAVSTLIWILFLLSTVLSHLATPPPTSSHPRRARVSFPSSISSYISDATPSLLANLAMMLSTLAHLFATLNAVWLIMSCIFQFSNFFDRCYCNSSVLGLGANAYDVIIFTNYELSVMKGAWIGGLVLAVGSAVGFVGFVYLWYEPDT